MDEQNKNDTNGTSEKMIVDLQTAGLKAIMSSGAEYPINVKEQILKLLALDAAAQSHLDSCNYWMEQAMKLQESTDGVDSLAFKMANDMHDKLWDEFKLKITFGDLTIDVPLWLVDNYEALCHFIRVLIDNNLDNC